MHAAQDKAHFPVDQLAYVYNKANGDVVEMHHVRVESDDAYAGGGVELQIFSNECFRRGVQSTRMRAKTWGLL